MSRRRNYESPVRAAQAEQTRTQIRQAAWECFQESGFERATVEQIASRAGVATPTVFASFESKAGIVASMLEQMEQGADLSRRSEAMMAEPDARRQLRAFASIHRALFDGGRGILRAALAARDRPEVESMLDGGDGHRRAALDTLAAEWHSRGVLRDGLGARRAAETMWLMSSVETYLLCIDRLGWSGLQYQRWLAAVIEREVLG